MAAKITQLLELGEKKGWIGVISVTIAVGVALLQIPEEDAIRLIRAWPLLLMPTCLWVIYGMAGFGKQFFMQYLEAQRKIAVVGERIEGRLNRVADQLEAFRLRLEHVENGLDTPQKAAEKKE